MTLRVSARRSAGRGSMGMPPPSRAWVKSSRSLTIRAARSAAFWMRDRKSTRLNSSHTVIYTLSLHDALPIFRRPRLDGNAATQPRLGEVEQVAHHPRRAFGRVLDARSEEHTSELQSHRDLHSFPTRRSSDLPPAAARWECRHPAAPG